jgi:transposase
VVVYVSTPVNQLRRTEVGPGAGELFESGPASRRLRLRMRVGAGSTILLPVCLVDSRERLRASAESLRAKADDREQLLWSAPALIAGEIVRDLNFAINPGGAGRSDKPEPPAPMSTAIVGLDVASTSARACVTDVTGAVVLEKDFAAITAGEDELLAALSPGSVIIMESTGRYHATWARRLQAAGHRVLVLNALLAKRLATTVNALRQRKTDAIDARHLAELGRLHLAQLGRFEFAEEPGRAQLRALCGVRRGIRHALTNAVRLAQHLLASMLPDTEAAGFNFAYNASLAELFLRIDSLGQLQRLRHSTLQQYACSRTATLEAILKQPRQTPEMFDALLPALQAQLRTVQALRDQFAALGTALRAAVNEIGHAHTAALIRSIPGYGEKTTPIIIGFLPTGWRAWGRKRQIANRLQAQWGCDPRPYESGKWQGTVHMSKRGAEMARTALFQVAVCALLHDPTMKAFYDKKRAAGQHHLIAITHVMRRQLRRLVAVLYDDKPFVPHPENAAT